MLFQNEDWIPLVDWKWRKIKAGYLIKIEILD